MLLGKEAVFIVRRARNAEMHFVDRESCNTDCRKVYVQLLLGFKMLTRGHCTYRRNNEAQSRDHCCRSQARSIKYSEFVFVALVIQHANRMHRFILPSVACPGVRNKFFSFSEKLHDFRRKVFEHKMRLLSFSTNFA
jgi:hypothetical protein